MFHLKDGLFFERQAHGGVRIVKTYDGRTVRGDNVVMDIPMDQESFASIVASMSCRGETAEAYREALNFLSRTVDEDSPATE